MLHSGGSYEEKKSSIVWTECFEKCQSLFQYLFFYWFCHRVLLLIFSTNWNWWITSPHIFFHFRNIYFLLFRNKFYAFLDFEKYWRCFDYLNILFSADNFHPSSSKINRNFSDPQMVISRFLMRVARMHAKTIFSNKF